jgi:hypothetical protein
LLAFFFVVSACEKAVVPKPKKAGTPRSYGRYAYRYAYRRVGFQNRRYSAEQVFQFTEADFYYSILKKHEVADSTFEQSLIYYSSLPKEFEKIYSRVLNKLNEMEQDQLKLQQQPVDIGTPQ